MYESLLSFRVWFSAIILTYKINAMNGERNIRFNDFHFMNSKSIEFSYINTIHTAAILQTLQPISKAYNSTFPFAFLLNTHQDFRFYFIFTTTKCYKRPDDNETHV